MHHSDVCVVLHICIRALFELYFTIYAFLSKNCNSFEMRVVFFLVFNVYQCEIFTQVRATIIWATAQNSYISSLYKWHMA